MATDTKRPKAPTLTSPRGQAIWPRLHEPDTKFNKAGVFSTRLRMNMADPKTQEFIAKLDELYDEGYQQCCQEEKKKKLKQADKPYKMVEDEDGEETGEVDVNFKLTATYTTKEGAVVKKRVLVTDAKRNPTKEPVGSGSTIRVAFQPNAWYVPALGAGLSLRLVAVQVIDLVAPGSGVRAEDVFEEEDGYEAGAEPVKAAVGAEESTEDADDGEDF